MSSVTIPAAVRNRTPSVLAAGYPRGDGDKRLLSVPTPPTYTTLAASATKLQWTCRPVSRSGPAPPRTTGYRASSASESGASQCAVGFDAPGIWVTRGGAAPTPNAPPCRCRALARTAPLRLLFVLVREHQPYRSLPSLCCVPFRLVLIHNQGPNQRPPSSAAAKKRSPPLAPRPLHRRPNPLFPHLRKLVLRPADPLPPPDCLRNCSTYYTSIVPKQPSSQARAGPLHQHLVRGRPACQAGAVTGQRHLGRADERFAGNPRSGARLGPKPWAR